MALTPNELRRMSRRGFARPSWSPTAAGSTPAHAAAHAVRAIDAALDDFNAALAAADADLDLSEAGRAKARTTAARRALSAIEDAAGVRGRLEAERAQRAAKLDRDPFGDDAGRRLDVLSRLWGALPSDRLDLVSLHAAAVSAGDELTALAVESRPALLGGLDAGRVAELRSNRVRAMAPDAAAELDQLDQVARDVDSALADAVEDITEQAGLDGEPGPRVTTSGRTTVTLDPAE